MKKRDIFLILGILLVSIVIYLVFDFTKTPGDKVIVRRNGVIVSEYSLSIDGEYSLNNGTNILIIENKKAYLKDANCPDKLCVNQGSIKYNGEQITCLPNKLTITVSGEDGFVELKG